MTTAEMLRRAATMLRQAAEQATRGPWVSYPTSGRLDGNDAAWTIGRPYCDKDDGPCDKDCGATVLQTGAEECEDDYISADDASYIALVDPAVGLALADWLDLLARVMSHGYGPNSETEAALAVARAILREDDADDT